MKMGFFKELLTLNGFVDGFDGKYPDIPQDKLKFVAKAVGYDGPAEKVRYIQYYKAKMGGIPFEMSSLFSCDMGYFKNPLTDPFSLKLYSDTEISFDEKNSKIFFNGQELLLGSSEEFEFLKELIAQRPASDKSPIALFERIAGPRIYCHGQIPEAKLQAALAEYKDSVQTPNAEDVIMLLDDTFWGKADNHLLITRDMLYIRPFLKLPMQRRLFSDTKISYVMEEGKVGTTCNLLINDTPVCSIWGEVQAKLLLEALQALQKDRPAGDDSYMGIFEKIIDHEISVKPYIPAKYLSNALTNFKLDLPAEEVLVLIDDTLSDSFKNGIIVTRNCLYVKGIGTQYAVNLSRDTKVQLGEGRQLLVNGKTVFTFSCSTQNEHSIQTLVKGLQCLIGRLPDSEQTKSELESKLSQIIHERFYSAPNIPKDKLANAIAEYASDVKPEEVLGLFDNSAWGNGKAGLLLTKDTLYADTAISPSWKKIFKQETTAKELISGKRKVTISPDDEITCEGHSILINGKVVCQFSLVLEKDIVPQLVEVIKLMKPGK